MTKTKEQLIEALVGDYNVVEGFVRFGLEQGLEGLLHDIQVLTELPYLPDHKREDLMAQCKTAKAFVEVLRYYTGLNYDKEREIIHKGFHKWTESL